MFCLSDDLTRGDRESGPDRFPRATAVDRSLIAGPARPGPANASREWPTRICARAAVPARSVRRSTVVGSDTGRVESVPRPGVPGGADRAGGPSRPCHDR